MRDVFYLAWRYVAHHRVKSLILTIGLTLTIVLPLATQWVIAALEHSMHARAKATPLVLGAKGNRFDLVLKALYFNSAQVDAITWADYEAIDESGLAAAIPLELSYTARGYPIVGATLDYFDFRGLSLAEGVMLQRIGQAVIGARVAEELDLRPGGALFSDQRSLYDITRTYPLKIQVVGVLAPAGTPDDRAVFVDAKTTWVIAGVTHGHGDVTREAPPGLILQRDDQSIRTTDAIVEYNEITDENWMSFHTHAEPEALPLSAVLVIPNDRKSETILKARYREAGTTQALLTPMEIVEELMQRVLQVQRLFNAAFALVAAAVVLFLVLVVLLSQRIRQREMETLWKIGCSRGMALLLQAAELGIVVCISAAVATGLAAAATVVVRRVALGE